jgi:HAD superfamily hydrolase (TIGR01509 family)
VIFDCDGTLVDSELLCNTVLANLLQKIGITEQGHELLQRYRGGRMATILTDLEHRHAQTLPTNFLLDYRAQVAQSFERELKAITGVHDLIQHLHGRYQLAVASSATRAKIEQSLRLTGLLQYFEQHIFSSYEVESWKPDPTLYLHTASALQVPPNHCTVIEDSLPGAEAAARAGMHCYLYDPTSTSTEQTNFGAEPFSDMRALTLHFT